MTEMQLPDGIEPYYVDPAGIVIYHADCRDVLPRLADDTVDFVFTDPPFGHNNNAGDLIQRWEAVFDGRPPGAARPIAMDGPEADDLFRWAAGEYGRLLADGGCCCACCCGGGGPDPQFARWSLWLDEAMRFKHMVVWDKGPMGMGHHYRRSYEVVLVAQKGSGPCRWYDRTKRVENVIRDIPKVIPRAADHPTVKPVALAKRFISYHTRAGDLVLDPFMGSGTTLRAAKDLGRRAIGIEIEEKYCEMAVKRLRQEVLPLEVSTGR